MGNIVFTPKKIEELKRLCAAGYTRAEIAEKFGVAFSTVSGRITRMGLLCAAGRAATADERFDKAMKGRMFEDVKFKAVS